MCETSALSSPPVLFCSFDSAPIYPYAHTPIHSDIDTDTCTDTGKDTNKVVTLNVSHVGE